MYILDKIKNIMVINDKDYVNKLKEVGFSGAVLKYPVFTQNSLIKALIDSFIEENWGLSIDINKINISKSSGGYTISYNDQGYSRTAFWVETPIVNFEGIPPKDVVESILRAKEHFNNFLILYRAEKPKEFVVIGRKFENDGLNYYINHWDHTMHNGLEKFDNLLKYLEEK